MKNRQFAWLAAVAGVGAFIAVLISPGGPGGPSNSTLFIPDFASRANDVSRIEISSAEGVVATLLRQESNWVVEQLHGYPARWQQVREMLAGLAQAEIVEYKTSNPDYLDRLGLQDPSVPGSAATGILLGTEDHDWSLVAGHGASRQDGQYFRVAGDHQSVLIDRVIDLPSAAIDWAEREILDISNAEVAEVVISHEDGERLAVSRVSADDADFTLEDIPGGREVRSTYTVNAVAGVFSMLRMDDVRPDELPSADVNARITAILFDGYRIEAEVIGFEDRQWLRLTFTPPADAEPEANAHAAAAQRTSGWLFAIPQSRLDSLTRRMDDLLKEPEDEGSG